MRCKTTEQTAAYVCVYSNIRSTRAACI
jgi:hypothetical protein